MSYRMVTTMKKHHHSKRWDGFNLHGYFFRGAVELRYHSGTVKYEKIFNWMVLNMAIIKFAMQARIQKFQRPKTNPQRIIKKLLKPYPKTLEYVQSRWKKFENGNAEDEEMMEDDYDDDGGSY